MRILQKFKINEWYSVRKLNLKVYVNQHNFVSDIQTPSRSWFLWIQFSSRIINEFHKCNLLNSLKLITFSIINKIRVKFSLVLHVFLYQRRRTTDWSKRSSTATRCCREYWWSSYWRRCSGEPRSSGTIVTNIPLTWLKNTNACILKAHSYSKSRGSIWASLECQCCFLIAGGLVSYLTMWLLALQLFENNNDTQGKLRLNFHSLSIWVWVSF